MGIFGLILLVAGIALMMSSLKRARKIDRDEFERTNRAGVREYADYEQMARVKIQKRRAVWAANFGGLLVLLGGILAVVGLAPESRGDALARYQKMCGPDDPQACELANAYQQCMAGSAGACGTVKQMERYRR